MLNENGRASLAVTHRGQTRRDRRTFRRILQSTASLNAQRLEIKAQTPSWLAKIEPEHEAALYALKHNALRQLFRIPNHSPTIDDAFTTTRGFLLSVRLNETGAFLHLPFDQLNTEVQRAHEAWIAHRARGKNWQTIPRNASGHRPDWYWSGWDAR